jgi:deoxyribose-phosphate aldolase
MYHEISFYHKYTKEEILQDIFTAIDKNIDGISVYSYYLKFIKKYLPEHLLVSSPVDYPLGFSELKVRQHAVISNISAGANAIDLQINNIYLLNDIKLFKKDLTAIKKICDEHGAKLRLYYEYRQDFTTEYFTKLKGILKEVDITCVFPSTGLYIDDYLDNIIACRAFMADSNIQTISTANIFNPHQYSMIKEAGIFGIKFNKIQSYINATGV